MTKPKPKSKSRSTTSNPIPNPTPPEYEPDGTLEEAVARARLQEKAEHQHQIEEFTKQAGFNPVLLRVILYFLVAVFTLVGTAPFIFIYLLREPPPVTYTQRKVLNKPVTPGGLPAVRPGEPLVIHIASDLADKCDATVYRVVVDASGRRHGFDPEPRPRETDYNVTIITPLEAFPGPAYYSGRIEWVCNWVQRWWPQVVFQKNLDFLILPAEKVIELPEGQLLPAPITPNVPPLIQPDGVPDNHDNNQGYLQLEKQDYMPSEQQATIGRSEAN